MDQAKERAIEDILESRVRPALGFHGGDIELIEIKNDIAYVKMTGRCSGCPSAMYTLESVVKEEILKSMDAVKDVKLKQEVSDDLINFAKSLMKK